MVMNNLSEFSVNAEGSKGGVESIYTLSESGLVCLVECTDGRSTEMLGQLDVSKTNKLHLAVPYLLTTYDALEEKMPVADSERKELFNCIKAVDSQVVVVGFIKQSVIPKKLLGHKTQNKITGTVTEAPKTSIIVLLEGTLAKELDRINIDLFDSRPNP